jgi:surfeit locus 1 family protein
MALSKAAVVGLSTSGKVFFGSLCVTTFGLGCWQTQRYCQKIDLIAEREEQLKLEPLTTTLPQQQNQQQQQFQQDFRRRLVSGTYDHKAEVLVGPRGPPPGALAQDGPSSGRSGGGMSSSPQGYFVVTPLKCSDGQTILINRGWIPRQLVKNDSPHTPAMSPANSAAATMAWNRPTQKVQVIGVPSPTEQPRFLTPQHSNIKKTPIELFWMDRRALEKLAGIPQYKSVMLTQVATTLDDDDDEQNIFPVQPSLETIGEHKVTPTVHAGYAFTWFGLSSAGLIMTRKLMLRGRG